jgi:hypothetical protein
MRDEYDEHLFGSLRQRSPAPCWLIFTRNCSKKLREASLSLDVEAISADIERIEPLVPDKAKDLLTLLYDFHMMRLRELIEKPG